MYIHEEVRFYDYICIFQFQSVNFVLISLLV